MKHRLSILLALTVLFSACSFGNAEVETPQVTEPISEVPTGVEVPVFSYTVTGEEWKEIGYYGETFEYPQLLGELASDDVTKIGSEMELITPWGFLGRVGGKPIAVFEYRYSDHIEVYIFKDGVITDLFPKATDVDFKYLYQDASISGTLPDDTYGTITRDNGDFFDQPVPEVYTNEIHSLLDLTKVLYYTYNRLGNGCRQLNTIKVGNTEHTFDFRMNDGCGTGETLGLYTDGKRFEHPTLEAETEVFSGSLSPDFTQYAFNYTPDGIASYVGVWDMPTNEVTVYQAVGHNGYFVHWGWNASSALWTQTADESFALVTNYESDYYPYSLLPYGTKVSEETPINEAMIYEGEKVLWTRTFSDSGRNCSYQISYLGQNIALPSTYMANLDNICNWGTAGFLTLSPDEEWFYFPYYTEQGYEIKAYHFADQSLLTLMSLYASTDGFSSYDFSPSGDRLAFFVVNQSRLEEYPTSVKLFVVDIEDGVAIKKQKFNVDLNYSCWDQGCGPTNSGLSFSDENTITYYSTNEEGERGELQTLSVE